MVVIIWGVAILLSPLLGRFGCGWICFMGTIQDLTGQHSLFRIEWKKPILWTRMLGIAAFFITAFTFFLIRFDSGQITGIKIEPWFLNMDFNVHYKQVWIYDTFGAVVLGLFLERRWACRNLCFMGAICAGGASFSRLIPVVDSGKCNLCGKCEADCLVRLPITNYVINHHGLVTGSECLLCGRCIASCKQKALKIKFVWNRKRHIRKFLTQALQIPENSKVLSEKL